MTYQSLESTVSNPNLPVASMSDLDEAARYMDTYGAVGLGEEAYDFDAADALKLFGTRD